MDEVREAVPGQEHWPLILASDRTSHPDPRIVIVCDELRERFLTRASNDVADLHEFYIDLAIAKTLYNVATDATQTKPQSVELLRHADRLFASYLAGIPSGHKAIGKVARTKRHAHIVIDQPSIPECIEVLRTWSIRAGHARSPEVYLFLTRQFSQRAARKYPFLPDHLRDAGVVTLLEQLLRPSLAAGLTPTIFEARTGKILASLLNDINRRESRLQKLLLKAAAEARIEQPHTAPEEQIRRGPARQLLRAIAHPFAHLRNVSHRSFKWRQAAAEHGITESKIKQDWRRVSNATKAIYRRLEKFGKVRRREIDRIIKSSHIPREHRDAVRDNVSALLRRWDRLLLLLPFGFRSMITRFRNWLRGDNESPPES